MKALSLKDLPKSYAVKLFELGYAAGECRKPEQFKKILERLKDIFPAEAVVCGYGTLAKGIDVSKLWNSPQAANTTIVHVESQDWPQSFLQPYLKENLLARDGHSYECIRTNKPQLWIDVYKWNKHPFDPWTKCGIDSRFVEIVCDHHAGLTLRKTHIDRDQRVGDFSLLFRRRKTADQFSQLWDGVVPYLHDTMLRTYEPERAKATQTERPPLSPREQEVLKWVMEGKSNWEIGMILNIAERTVKYHVQNLMRKLEATNRSHLVANACQRQLNGRL